MNFKSIGYVVGWIMKIEALFLLLPLGIALLFKEQTWVVFFGIALVSGLIGVLLSGRKMESIRGLYAREGYASVAVGWIVMSMIGALPFYISGEIPSYTDALFEIVSGFTTTGASILCRVEDLSQGMLFWRSFSHWIGGMGVLVFLLQIMPAKDGQNMHLMRAESPGPSVSKLVPRVRDTAVYLYGIYMFLTVLEMGVLILFGMPWFDSVCTSFGTAGTGGFGIHSESIGCYSPAIQWVITFFMLAFGINFSFYYLCLVDKFKDAFHMQEVHAYLGIFTAATILIAVNIGGNRPIGTVLRDSAFAVSSIMTTTGFATADFDKWPEFSRFLLVVLMLFGACAGSTGGGIKISRLMMYLKTVRKELGILLHPRAVKVVTMDGKKVEHTVLRGANIFLISYVMILVVSTLLVSLDNFDIVTNVTAVISALSNIGPGLSLVGPTGNFAMFSDFAKYVLMFDMLAGRLEIFPMLLLLTPQTWNS